MDGIVMDGMAHAALACAALLTAAATQAPILALPGPEEPCAEGDFASVLATLLWV